MKNQGDLLPPTSEPVHQPRAAAAELSCCPARDKGKPPVQVPRGSLMLWLQHYFCRSLSLPTSRQMRQAPSLLPECPAACAAAVPACSVHTAHDSECRCASHYRVRQADPDKYSHWSHHAPRQPGVPFCS